MLVTLDVRRQGIVKINNIQVIYPSYVDPSESPDPVVLSYDGQHLTMHVEPCSMVKLGHGKKSHYFVVTNTGLLVPSKGPVFTGYAEYLRQTVHNQYNREMVKHFLHLPQLVDDVLQTKQQHFGKFYSDGKLMFAEIAKDPIFYSKRGAHMGNGFIYCPCDKTIYYPKSQYDDIKAYHRAIDKPHMDAVILKDLMDRFDPCA